ncbi:Kazal type serine protease inhibitor-like venom protein-like precursor [Nasonia vitripennis]|uniref:Kazal-like domain-containing protein n=1 Tax=Nasonia vitripennis TaxID=7425 RepID=A0A7M6UVY6_NASVI|nr:Kazal type serine protease inhibitor-like venom protein-like precursor [Nasonia vitripennis]
MSKLPMYIVFFFCLVYSIIPQTVYGDTAGERACMLSRCFNEIDLVEVCGSDGHTWPSMQYMRCSNECKNMNVQFVHYGRCGRWNFG